MSNKAALFPNGNVMCKSDQYLQPNLKKNSYEMPFASQKKIPMHIKRLSGILPPPCINKSQDSMLQTLEQKGSKKGTDGHQKTNSTLLSRKNYEQRKQEMLRLQKLFPKNINIKFEEGLDLNSLHNKSKHSRSPRIVKTVSPFKIFEIAENRFYIQLQNQRQRLQKEQKENQSATNTINTLFNVKSIKMIKKITQNLSFNDQKQTNNKNVFTNQSKLKTKYQSIFKKKIDYSVQYEKENSQKAQNHQNNFKLSLKSIRSFEQLNNRSKSSKSPIRLTVLKPLSQLKDKENKKQERLQSIKNIVKTQHKPQRSDAVNYKMNRSSTILSKKRQKSKELTQIIFCPNNYSLNSSLINSQNAKILDARFMSKKFESIFEGKITKYLMMLKANAQILGIEICFPESYSRNQFCFYVGKGNNSKLVKQMLKKRWWLGSCEDKKDLLKNNVIWTQLKEKAYYSLNQVLLKAQTTKDSVFLNEGNEEHKPSQQQLKRLIIHNHFQQNQFLGNKKALFYNMKAYYESQNKKVFDFLPLTFHITSFSDQSWTSFLIQFNKINSADPTAKNIWILKPGQNSNRGNGITVHNSIESIKISMNLAGDRQKSTRTYILQKYIQRPFLYNRRKFDIRCYMLLVRVNETIKGFWYKEGYIRTSGYEFTLEDCANSYVHLTNDAIQQHCQNYGKYEDKNKLSYESFQKYLDTHYNTPGETQKKYDLEKHIIPKLRNVCIDSIKACSNSIGRQRDGLPTFELFGLDFMIDEHFNPWLIEINTNPCLETQGRVLEKVIVPLLDNVFKLTVDCFIPPPLNWSNSNKHLLSKNCDKNLFELVFDEASEKKSSERFQVNKDLPMHMIGQIDEDNEVYEEDED